MAVHSQRLAGDAGAAVGTEKENGFGDVVGGDERAERAFATICGAKFGCADTARSGFGGDYTVDARPFHGAGADRIDPDPEGSSIASVLVKPISAHLEAA